MNYLNTLVDLVLRLAGRFASQGRIGQRGGGTWGVPGQHYAVRVGWGELVEKLLQGHFWKWPSGVKEEECPGGSRVWLPGAPVHVLEERSRSSCGDRAAAAREEIAEQIMRLLLLLFSWVYCL